MGTVAAVPHRVLNHKQSVERLASIMAVNVSPRYQLPQAVQAELDRAVFDMHQAGGYVPAAPAEAPECVGR